MPKALIIVLVVLTLGIITALMLPRSGPQTDGQTIRVVRNIGGRAGFRQHWELWSGAFAKANPGWKMELLDLGDNDASAYYKTRIAAQDLPEVLMTWNMVRFLADGGHLMPLPEAFYQRFGIEKPVPYRGQCYTSQSGLQLLGVAVNRTQWAAVGITEPPATWDAFVAGLRALKAKGYQPLALGGREWSAGVPLMIMVDSDLYERQGSDRPSWTKRRNAGEVRFATDPTMRTIMSKLVALIEEFAVPGTLSDGYAEEGRLFFSGKAATWIMGCWLAGELAGNKVEQDIAYWPMPSMVGRPPVYVANVRPQNGWAISAGVSGEKRAKSLAVLEAFYDPAVYQAFLDGEAQFPVTTTVDVKGPQSPWPSAQRLFSQMRSDFDRFGSTPGHYLAADDVPPTSFQWQRVPQAILAGNRDVDRLLALLDDEWDRARKGE